MVAEDFTFANVRRAVTGIARYVISNESSGARVIVGRDPRFLGETFCAIAAEVLAGHGIAPLVIARCRAHAGDCLRSHSRTSRRRHQLYGFAQSTGVQRH